MIRAAREDDIGWILALSARHEAETSPLDAEKLRAMMTESWATHVFEDRRGYLIVFDETANYGSLNFRWFCARYPKFLYVDRIVISEAARGEGRGRRLYEDLFERGRQAGYSLIACEVNLAPPNRGSDAFHAKMGFLKVGRAELDAGKTVRYLTRAIG